MPWTDEEVVTHIETRLGAPIRAVELDEKNYSEAIKRSVRKWSVNKPFFKYSFLNVAFGVQAYNLTTLGKPFGKGIVEVYQEPITSPSQVFTEFEYYRLRQPPYIDLGELVMDRAYYQMIGQITGTEFDWIWDRDTTVLLISPIPSRAFKLSYLYNDSAPATIAGVPEYDQGWVVDYALALCKEMLGRVRGKYKGVPGNEITVDTDGAELLSEGLEEQKDLIEGLQGTHGDQTPPIFG